jgi:hypothetical protein
MLTLITDHFRNIKKNICCTKLFVKNIPKILSFILLDDHLSNSLFKFNALWDRTFFDGLGILKPQYISFYFIYNSACNNKTPTEVTKSILMHSTNILKSSVKKHRHSLARSFIIIFVHSCKKHGLECFFVENICFSKGLRPIHIGANRISCFDNMNNFTLIGV